MKRLLSILLSLADDLIPLFKPSNSKGFIPVIFLLAANSVPAVGVILFGWNPYMLLFVYWGESLIAGFFNVLKMIISGSIDKGKFSSPGLLQSAGTCLFFIFHYGMFMLVHFIFLVVFMYISASKGSDSIINPVSSLISLYHGRVTWLSLIESEFSAVVALFISYLVSFYVQFIKTGEYNHTTASYYFIKPYKRIIIMHLTIIFGAFILFFSGFRSAGFIIVWIGIKIFSDLKMHAKEINASFQFSGSKILSHNSTSVERNY